MTNPTYTIAIPVYDRVLGFQNALASALAVDGCSEIIVVDDCSKHNEFKKIAEGFNSSKIKYFKNEKNLGLFANWNRCVETANSEFISILCSDDIIVPDAYRNFIEAYNQSPIIDVFFGSHVYFYERIEDKAIMKSFNKGLMKPIDLLENLALNGPGFPVLTISRKTTLLRMPFVAKPHSGNDWLWIYSNASNLNLYSTDKIINYWRRHDEQDAVKSQDITQDCWPLMFYNAYTQLLALNSKHAQKAYNRAVGFIASCYINDKSNNGYWGKRLRDADQSDNIFLLTMGDIIKQNWLLKHLNSSKRLWFFYFNIARVFRRLNVYPVS